MELDETNRVLLDLLQGNARTTVADLSRVTGRAETTVRERLSRLTDAGVLTGYRAILDLAKAGYPTVGHLRAKVNVADLDGVRLVLAKVPELTRAVLTTGPRPLLLEVRAETIHEIERIVETELAPLPIEDVDLRVATKSMVVRRPYPLGQG